MSIRFPVGRDMHELRSGRLGAKRLKESVNELLAVRQEALESDPTIGLVGPCSNFVSGRQQVAVRYDDLTGSMASRGIGAKPTTGDEWAPIAS